MPEKYADHQLAAVLHKLIFNIAELASNLLCAVCCSLLSTTAMLMCNTAGSYDQRTSQASASILLNFSLSTFTAVYFVYILLMKC